MDNHKPSKPIDIPGRGTTNKSGSNSKLNDDDLVVGSIGSEKKAENVQLLDRFSQILSKQAEQENKKGGATKDRASCEEIWKKLVQEQDQDQDRSR